MKASLAKTMAAKTMPTKAMASAAEVAKLAGVSRSAVSRTFTPGASVSEQTREKVLAAAKTLNYHVNHLARSLSKDSSRPVCILGANLNAPFQASLLDILTQNLQRAGKAVMVINTAGGRESTNESLSQTLNYRAFATIVLSGTPDNEYVQTCIDSGQHVILINRGDQFAGADHFVIDYESIMADAHYLFSEAGCRQLAVISSTNQSPSLLARERFFIQAAEQHQHSCTLLRVGPTAYQTGVEAARQLLSGRKRPDGVFCVTDLIACGFMDVAREEFALTIPDDICVIGFDDIEQASWHSYQLTTFKQPLEEMAQAIVKRLIWLAEETPPPETYTFSARAQWRKSVRPKP